MAIRSSEARTFPDRLRMSGDPQREVLWERRTSADSKALWEITCPERWELLPPSERNMRSRCCAAVLWLGEILLWNKSKPQGTIAEAKVCGGCGKPTSGLIIKANVPEFTKGLHQAILSDFENALAGGVEIANDGTWNLTDGKVTRRPILNGRNAKTAREIEKALNANVPEPVEFPVEELL